MTKINAIAQELAKFMPVIGRSILMEFFQTFDIPQTQLFALMALQDMGECRLGELSQKLNVSAPTASGIVDRMVKSGYVIRDHDTEDRRAVKICLSSKGKKYAKHFRETITKRWSEVLGRLPEKDREGFLRIILKIKDIL